MLGIQNNLLYLEASVCEKATRFGKDSAVAFCCEPNDILKDEEIDR